MVTLSLEKRTIKSSGRVLIQTVGNASSKQASFEQNFIASDEDPLLPRDPDDGRGHTVSVPQALKTSELRLPLTIVSLAMIAQQVSG